MVSSHPHFHPCLSRLTSIYPFSKSCISHLGTCFISFWMRYRGRLGEQFWLIKGSCKGTPAQMSPEKRVETGSWEGTCC